ncbi:MAG: hypothetical protein QOJ93_2176 [Actinomycetota bacterium]|nr:hypothetical protein [Actinomycetota bacterium]
MQRKVAFAWRPSEVLRFDEDVYLAIDKFEQLKADLRSIRAECEEWNDSGRLPRADYAWLLRKLMRVMDFINEVDGTRVPLAKRTEVIEDIDDLTGDLARWREKIEQRVAIADEKRRREDLRRQQEQERAERDEQARRVREEQEKARNEEALKKREGEAREDEQRATRQKKEEQAALRKQQEVEARQKKQEQAALRKQQEDEARQKKQEDKEARLRHQEEHARRKQQEEERQTEEGSKILPQLIEAHKELSTKVATLNEPAARVGVSVEVLARDVDRVGAKLAAPPAEVYRSRDDITARISGLNEDADAASALIDRLQGPVATLEQHMTAVRLDFDTIDDLLGNERTKNRNSHKKTRTDLAKEVGEIQVRRDEILQKFYRMDDPVGALKTLAAKLEALSERIAVFRGQVEEDQPEGSGASQGPGTASPVAVTGTVGKITERAYMKIDRILCPDSKLRDLLSSVTSGQGGQGVKALSGAPGGYTHELKFLGGLGGSRAYGKIDPGDGLVLFTKFGRHL